VRLYESQQNATNLNVSVLLGSAATYSGAVDNLYTVCWKFTRLSSGERILKIG